MGHQQSQEISRFKTNHHLASVIRPPTSPSAAYSIGNALPSQKGEAAISDFRFCCDTLNHRTAESQARERCNNAGRVIGQLSEANRALYPTRVHYFVIRQAQPSNVNQPMRLGEFNSMCCFFSDKPNVWALTASCTSPFHPLCALILPSRPRKRGRL